MALKATDSEDHHDANRFSSLLGTLSLFIQMVAFFMMINATSSYDNDRVRPILKSLQETFTTRVFREDVGPSLAPDVEQQSGAGHEAYQSLDNYFRTSFPGFSPQMIPTRGIFYLELPLDQFEAKFFNPNPKLQKTLIEKMWAYQHLQMEIWLNLEEDPGASSSDARDELRAKINKLSGWAAQLEKNGLQHGTLTIGLQKGDPKKVVVLFHNYNPYAPDK